MSRDPDDVLQDLATELHGKGSAISVDPGFAGWTINVWDSKGRPQETFSHASKRLARKLAIDALRSKLRRVSP